MPLGLLMSWGVCVEGGGSGESLGQMGFLSCSLGWWLL